MVMSVLWGDISAVHCRRIMALLLVDLQSMKNDTLDIKPIVKMAGLGSEGKHACHVWRNFKNMRPTPKLPKLHWEFLPLKHLKFNEFFQAMPILLPHELFAAIYHHYPVMFDKLVYGSAEICSSFWHAVAGGEQFRSLPI